MVSESLQPLNTLGPMGKGTGNGQMDENNPGRQDYRKGREQYTAGDYTEAALSFHNALKVFEEQGDEQGIANASDRLGDTCMAKEEYAMALDNYNRAFAICKKEEDSFSILSLNKKMAASHRKLGQFDQAMKILDDMLEHYQLTKNPKGVVETLIVMAEVFIQQGKIEAAADTYNTISSIHAAFKHTRLAEEFAVKAKHLIRE